MIELLMSMEINDFFFPAIEDKKRTVQATLNRKLRNSPFLLTHSIPNQTTINIGFYLVFFTIYSSIATAENYQY
jgi:hypothetical protein